MKQRPLSWMQRQFMEVLKDGQWHKAPAVVTGSGIRGLISRGLIEHRNPREHMFSWVRDGEFRLARAIEAAANTEEGGRDG